MLDNGIHENNFSKAAFNAFATGFLFSCGNDTAEKQKTDSVPQLPTTLSITDVIFEIQNPIPDAMLYGGGEMLGEITVE